MTTRIILPWNGPAKSIWSLTQGREGHFHGWSGATGGVACCCWQRWHCCTDYSISLSIRDHQTYILASAFILVIPGCPSWSSSSTVDRPWGGMTTLEPHITQPWNTDSSLCLALYVERDLSQIDGHPRSTYCETLDRTGSLLVQTRMCRPVAGDSSKWSIKRTSSGGVFDSVWVCGRGSRLSASAFWCSCVFWKVILYSYADRSNDQCLMRAEACAEVGRCSWRRANSGWWSVTNSKWCPNKKEWKRLTQKTRVRASLSSWE